MLLKIVINIFFSWFNRVEVSRVMYYLDELLNVGINGTLFTQNDIGIISPYRKQVSKKKITFFQLFHRNVLFQCAYIEDACRKKGWRDIMISSVELFQGKEKKIIIVSTVRSQSDNIGFLNNFRVN